MRGKTGCALWYGYNKERGEGAGAALHRAHLDAGMEPNGTGEWWPIDRIGEAGLPTLFARAVEAVRRDKDARDAKD